MPSLGQVGYGTALPVDYVLRQSDVISVTVFREPDLSLGETPISADGHISVPLLGTIQAAGLTTSELESQLERSLDAQYLRDANVSVNVLEAASHRVVVEGQVEQPGIFTFQPGTRLSGAIALAQGMVREADRSNVAIFRESPDGPTVAKFDYGAVQAGRMLDPVLMPGDRVVVGTSALSQGWQDALKAIPVFALFTRL
ncbi:polysaccharide biosynthesis/export family protein [Aurantiacibacter spongiae]|uniref:polysaccharide biosynthesis/export family protein n=1 Tax=Aurantiacibacter spongiae TaxID=2488860 RepID=UPI001F40D596|nr:polysaccharide biosynthesis/export family protein [Aurantiacibacter spongiae]